MSALIEAKQIQAILAETEKDAQERNMKAILSIADKDERDRQTTITAVRIETVREIRDRLGIPEIKA